MARAATHRRSASAVSSRLGVLVPSGDRPGPTEPAGETGELTLAPVQDADARPRGLHPRQFAPWSGGLRRA